jgi:glycosyltransferase involved in cell wall biosynthesis
MTTSYNTVPASHDLNRECKARVLVISKRQYMGRDLLDDRYGRFWELPEALQRLGHEVQGLCLSYRRRAEGIVAAAPVAWRSANMRRLLPVSTSSYWQALRRIGERFRPEVIWACSDVPHALLGRLAARRLRTRLVIDLYDNFESYPLARIPGSNLLLRQAVRSADGVSCVSEPLAQLVRKDYGYSGPLAVIENAIPPGLFVRKERQSCRAALGLPADALLIGTAGALSAGRGTQYLLQAFQQLARKRADAHLVLAGALDRDFEIPQDDPRIHHLGLLAPTGVPVLISALDIAVVCNRDSLFGRYCFPQKLYEALACGVPVAVARVGAMATLLQRYPENLYEPDDVASLLSTLERLCDAPSFPALEIPTWPMLADRLSDLLQRACAGGARS